MKSTFLALAIATAALNLFAPAVGHAQDYIVNGHNASKASASIPASTINSSSLKSSMLRITRTFCSARRLTAWPRTVIARNSAN